MEKKNTGLIVLVIILSLLVVGLSSFIIYDKVLKSEDNNANFGEITNEKNDSNLDSNTNKENITTEEIKEIFEFVFDYMELPFVYCGEYESITDINDAMDMYRLSKEYTTYNELMNDLKKYMSSDVISKGRFSSSYKEHYVEKEGKLYCEETYKGYLYSRGNIEVEITSQTENKVTCLATMELTDMSNIKTYDKVNITLEKDNNNWIITSYEKQQ